MTRNLVLCFAAGMAIAAVFLGIALAGQGRGAVRLAAERPGCRTVIGIALGAGRAGPAFAADHSRCRLVA
jgi:hypothetical protein